jgi:hypothetical protein
MAQGEIVPQVLSIVWLPFDLADKPFLWVLHVTPIHHISIDHIAEHAQLQGSLSGILD